MKIITKLVVMSLLTLSLAYAVPYKLDTSHTKVGFLVKHMMITNVRGEFKNFSANIDFDSKTKSFKTLNAIIQTKSIDTDNTKRDKHLKSKDFFLANKFPQITFKMKSYKANGNKGVMIGDLTIKGITKEVKLKIEDLATIKDFKGNNRLGFSLKGEISRIDYGLKWNRSLELGGVVASEKVKLQVDVEAVQK